MIRRLCGCVLVALAFGVAPQAVQAFEPSFEEVRRTYRSSDAVLLDRNGLVIDQRRVVSRGRRLDWVAFAEISPALVQAVLHAEDRRFYRHAGVDWAALGSALLKGVTADFRGASTISMQVASLLDKNLRGMKGRKTLWQKWQQIRAAQKLEADWSKAQILEAYLNLVSFRGEVQGVTAAALGLFDKRPHGLSDSDSVILAALLPSPNAEAGRIAARACVLARGLQLADSCEAVSAKARTILSGPPVFTQRESLAPHVAVQLLNGAGLHGSSGPSSVTSTLDGQLQRVAAEMLRQQLQGLRAQHVEDGAVLVADNATGEVLAYVGSSGDLSQSRYVDGVRAKRQAGSTLKPFLYGLAFELRLLTPATVLDDNPLEIPVENGVYRPKNYDRQFHGLVTARTALASSLNVPAVKVLRVVGADAFVQQLQRAGFQGVDEAGDFYGPALALGSADVSLWELVNAYRTLANGGVWSALRLTADARASRDEARVLSQESTFLISDILSDRDARSTTFGWESPLASRFWSAVKTGTSKDMRDNWCVGYTNRYTVGVWVGNFSGEPMWNVSGMSGAAPVWMDLMNWLHRDEPSVHRGAPDGLVHKIIGQSSGAAARMEWFRKGTEPQAVGIVAQPKAPRIAYPVSGTILASDPDIPDDQQRIFFEVRPADPLYRWRLDGRDIGPAKSLTVWQPVPGRHVLALVGPDQRVADTVEFRVRKSEPSVQDAASVEEPAVR